MATANEMMKAAMKKKDITQAEVAHELGWFPQQLSSRMIRNSTRADEFIKILDIIGFELVMVDKETGDFVNSPGYGRKVKMMVDHIIYDTAKSCALSNSFFADGVNEYNADGEATELYVDHDGRYFMAKYSNLPGVKDRIVPVTSDTATEFIKRYGTDLHKDKSTS